MNENPVTGTTTEGTTPIRAALPITVLTEFFSVPGHPVTMEEIKELVATVPKDERREMARQCARAIGCRLA